MSEARPFNAANRKDIRQAEKSQVAVSAINRDVIAGLMSLPNGRHWVYDQLAAAYVFADPFSSDPHIHAYQAGLRNRGIALFNDIMLYAPSEFVTMLREANERAITDAARRSTSDAEPDSGTDADSDAA